MQAIMHSSRSATECYQECPRRRYLQYHYKGKGIRPIARSIPLVTGTAVHTGIAILLRAIKRGLLTNQSYTQILNFAVAHAKAGYLAEVEGAGFQPSSAPDQAYTLAEQMALAEALIVAWSIIEAPFLQEQFTILAVEEDYPLDLGLGNAGIVYTTRADALLQERADGRIYVYSLKTTKLWNERVQKSYREDLQGITELLGARQHFSADKDILNSLAGVRYCFLIKGDRKLNETTNRVEQVSPLIAGYHRSSACSVDYAHSWFYPNSSNTSGYSALGRGWSKFKVWDSYPGGLREWLARLANNEIQPECGDILRQTVIHPLPSFRDDIDLDSTLAEVAAVESRIKAGLDFIARNAAYPDLVKPILYGTFTRNRRSCRWPTDCDFIPICHEGLKQPLLAGYEFRKPHHQGEADYQAAQAAQKEGK